MDSLASATFSRGPHRTSGALLLHGCLFSDVLPCRFQLLQVPKTLISAFSTQRDHPAVLGLPRSAAWPGKCSQEESQAMGLTYLMSFLPLEIVTLRCLLPAAARRLPHILPDFTVVCGWRTIHYGFSIIGSRPLLFIFTYSANISWVSTMQEALEIQGWTNDMILALKKFTVYGGEWILNK